MHEEFEYVVSGIASETGKVVDNLILSNIQSVWLMHDHEHEESEENPAHGQEGHVHFEGDEHELHDHEHDDHGHEHVAPISENGKEITAVLIKFRNKMGFVTWPRLVAQNTKMQAASPAVEINRLFLCSELVWKRCNI